MSLRSYEEARKIIRSNPEISDFSGPKDMKVINEAEQVLGLRFPISYKAFLHDYGCGGFGAIEFYGIVSGDIEAAGVPNGIWETLDCRKNWNLPHQFVVVGTADDGTLLAIDTSRTNENGEAPVIRYEAGLPPDKANFGDTSPDFGELFLESIKLGLEWSK